MAKGFSFVLVTVVMIVMLVFGLLSLSSSAANLRLANKAANAQTTYYAVDAKGEMLIEQCAKAAEKSQQAADSFIAQKAYAGKLPDDLYADVKTLCAQAAGSDSAQQSLKKGIFFYYLSKSLSEQGLKVTVDQKALTAALNGGDGSAPIVTVDETVKSTTDAKCSLHVTLTFNAAQLPQYKRAKWVYSVQTPEVDGNQHLDVWQGK